MSKFRLDEVDHQILDMLIDNTRVPFTDIAKNYLYLQELYMSE
jgi:Lrp/AsnC family transcriptional regulator for asnA, asnC and gidA